VQFFSDFFSLTKLTKAFSDIIVTVNVRFYNNLVLTVIIYNTLSMSKPNIIKIAKVAGVSTATVSRVFNNSGNTSEKACEKVISAAKELGYMPKVKLGENNIAVLVEGAAGARLGDYSIQLINKIGGGLFSRGLGLEIIPVSNINHLKKKFFKTAISLIFSEPSENIVREANLDIPLILINNQLEGFANVCSDHRQGIHLAVEHLYKRGHRKIALLVSSLGSWGSMERFLGYKKALAKFGIEYNKGLIADLNATDHYLEILADTLRHNPDSIIISGESNGIKASHALNSLGKKIPEDLSVISFESENISAYLEPPHTTICQDFDLLAEYATEFAVKALNGDSKLDPKVKILLKNKLTERYSVINRGG
jgi:DNA-binding LacI/PurR family transcriptional regulator